MMTSIAPTQLSNARDRPGVETSPRGWHTNPLATSAKESQALAASALSIPAPFTQENRETCLVLAFFFPCWVAGGGHRTNTTLAKGRLYSLAGGYPGASASEGEGTETHLS